MDKNQGVRYKWILVYFKQGFGRYTRYGRNGKIFDFCCLFSGKIQDSYLSSKHLH